MGTLSPMALHHRPSAVKAASMPESTQHRNARRLGRLLLLATATLAATAPAAQADRGDRATKLERQVLQSVQAAGFGDVIDGEQTPNAGPPWYPRIAHTPQVDVAVLELDHKNRVKGAANVLMDRDHPDGVLVPIGRDLSSSAVRYRKWDLARWDGEGPQWEDDYGPDEDVVPGREGAPLQFMEPYPASALKVMVAYGIARLVDQRKTTLDTRLDYAPDPANCYGTGGSETVREWMRLMITQSDNEATCALIKQLHDLGQMDALNAHFVAAGVPSLSLRNTRTTDGGGWSKGRGVHMGGLDTAKLLWLIDGGPGVLWRGSGGRPVTAAELSGSSRDFLKLLLAGQGFNEVLATTNWCGATLGSAFPNPLQPYPAPGIPTATPANFILGDGTVEVEGIPYGQVVAPCNEAAEVVFSHKTGLVTNAGADVGYVHELPGQRRRDYVIAVFTNLGNRFGDPVMNTSKVDPYDPDYCWSAKGVCYTEAFAKLGRSIDTALQDGKRGDGR